MKSISWRSKIFFYLFLITAGDAVSAKGQLSLTSELQSWQKVPTAIPAGGQLQRITNIQSMNPIPSDDSTIKWQAINTAEDLYRAYPQKVDSLLQRLDLDRPGLKEAKLAYQKGDLVSACNLILSYYKQANTVGYLRKNCLPSSVQRDSKGDSLLQNLFVFYKQSDIVPTSADGHMNWKYHGPADDIEWAWALNRHYYLDDLFKAWLNTGNPEYADKIDMDVKDWIISSWPYPGVKSSTELWRGLEVSFRVKVWSRIFYGLMDCPQLSAATRLLMLSSIPDHAHYLKNFHSQGNWLTMEMSGLATAATAWPEFKKSPPWLAYSKETMTESLKKQVYPDGVQTELTSHYHQVALNNFSLFMNLCEEANEPLSPLYASRIQKMWNYIAYTMRPDGYGLLNNDADLDYNRDNIINKSAEYGRKDWLYIASNGAKGTKPDRQPSIFFPWAGHFIMRSGFDPNAQWAFFDMGPWGTGHQHNDKLHLSVSAFGRDFLVDGGRFAYRGDVAKKFRKYAEGSSSHNVILIDGAGQTAGPELNTQPIASDHYKIAVKFDFAWSSFDQFIDVKGESNHTRSIFYVRGKFWVVVDRINTDRPRNIEVLWHWHPDCKVVTKNDNIVATANEKGNLEIIPVAKTPLSLTLVKGQDEPQIQGWYSQEYNTYEPNTASIYSAKIDKSAVFVWVLYPSENNLPTVHAEITSQNKNGLTVEVNNRGEGKWLVKIPFSNSNDASFDFRKSKDNEHSKIQK